MFCRVTAVSCPAMLATLDLVENNTNGTTVSVFGIMVSKLG